MKHLNEAHAALEALIAQHKDAFVESNIIGYLEDALSDHNTYIESEEEAAAEYVQQQGWDKLPPIQDTHGTLNKAMQGVK